MTKAHVFVLTILYYSGMGIFLSHSTAALYWLKTGAPLSLRGAKDSPDAQTPGIQECRDVLASLFFEADFIEATTASCNKNSNDVALIHVCPAHIPRSYLKIRADLYVACPELAFVQAASLLDFLSLVEFGNVLCSTYCSNDFSPAGFSPREALTSQKRIEHFISRNHHLRGSHVAQRATAYLCDGSASPAETNVAMLMTLPHKYGGYGFRHAFLNYRIDINAKSARVASKSFYKADLAWPQKKLTLEYDSDSHHANPEGIAADSKKRNALAIAGWTTVSLTRAQLYSRAEMDKVALFVAKRLEKRMAVRTDQCIPAREALRRQVLFGSSLHNRIIEASENKFSFHKSKNGRKKSSFG